MSQQQEDAEPFSLDFIFRQKENGEPFTPEELQLLLAYAGEILKQVEIEEQRIIEEERQAETEKEISCE